MNTTKKIEKKINRFREGITFKYNNLDIARDEYAAATKAMERFVREGKIRRVSTGVFYKPKQTVFGEIKPNEEELLKPYLFVDGQRIGYITGTSLYNQMGLTTQVPTTIKVASKTKRVTIKLGKVPVKPVKSYVDVSKENYKQLEILDALKDLKSIPDSDKENSLRILEKKIQQLEKKGLRNLISCAKKYPPRTRALLGAIIENLQMIEAIERLKETLNPLTTFEIGIREKALPTINNWNIH